MDQNLLNALKENNYTFKNNPLWEQFTSNGYYSASKAMDALYALQVQLREDGNPLWRRVFRCIKTIPIGFF